MKKYISPTDMEALDEWELPPSIEKETYVKLSEVQGIIRDFMPYFLQGPITDYICRKVAECKSVTVMVVKATDFPLTKNKEDRF